MGFGEAVSTCFRKYVDFGGRAPRSEFWYFRLFAFLLFIGVFAIIGGIGAATSQPDGSNPVAMAFGLLMVAGYLAFFIPDLAVTVRRLHDTNRSGWWYLLNLVPIGPIVLLVWFCTEGTRGDNNYGPDPFGPSARVFE